MKVKDVAGKEKEVSAQSGTGYYSSNDERNIMGFRYEDNIYVLSTSSYLDYQTESIYDTSEDVFYNKVSLYLCGTGVSASTSSSYRWNYVNDIPLVTNIVAQQLDCKPSEIDIVMLNINPSDRLSSNHASWKREGDMPVVAYNGDIYYKWEDDGETLQKTYRISYTGAWPLPKHVMDRCLVTEVKDTVTTMNERQSMMTDKVELI
tara:strand:- start:285 stop:899 length:615 start_codon:yes stop_codon:yes gene_type:complete